jgi:hypothetical protein
MNTYFSAFRVDHILGFFRLWELPPHAITGLSGHFNPSSPVSAADLDKLGLWDRQRLSTPYVRAHLLQRRFGRYLRAVACCTTEAHLAFPHLFLPSLGAIVAAVLKSALRCYSGGLAGICDGPL